MTNHADIAAQLPARARNALITLVAQEGHYRDFIVRPWELGMTAGNMLVKRGLATKHVNSNGSVHGFKITDDGMAVFTEVVNYTPERRALLTRVAQGFDGGITYERVGTDLIDPVFGWRSNHQPFEGGADLDLDDLLTKELIWVQGTLGFGFLSTNARLSARGQFLLDLWNEQHPA